MYIVNVVIHLYCYKRSHRYKYNKLREYLRLYAKHFVFE